MFQCDKCGMCCKHLKECKVYSDLDRGDGICKNYDEKSCLCTIYYNRPIKCRIDEMYEQHYYKFYSKEEYYNLNYEACKKLKLLERKI